jgi:hypothetical protein
MTNVIVYRCESPHYPDCHNHPPYKLRDWSKLPGPSKEDTLLYIKDTEVCGCSSLKQFKLWWPKGKWITKATNNKYYIFSVPKEYVRKGKHQVVFERSKATKIGELTEDHKKVFYV